MIRCALPKGNMKEIGRLLHRAGISIPPDIDESRQYIVRGRHLEFILVKPKDVPVIVEYGAADIGIAGKDALQEQRSEVIELLDLRTNSFRLAVLSLRKELPDLDLTIGTAYPRIAAAFFLAQGRQAKVITLNGNVRAAASLGLVDAIVDSDKQEEGYEPFHSLDSIMDISDRLIANRVSYVHKFKDIQSICAAVSPSK